MSSKGAVAVIGAGLMGTSWAGLFAAHGYEVRLYDGDPIVSERAPKQAAAITRFLVAKGLADSRPAEEGLSALRRSATLEEAVAEAALVQECVPDNLALKCAVFARISRAAPEDALIASSTSGLSMTAIQRDAHLPGRTFAAHPFNPPHLVPLVELAAGDRTDPGVLERARLFYLGLGKQPVVLKGDIPGYIGNRLADALWREAVQLVRSGAATVEDVDRVVRYGLGLRWAVVGPHLTFHLAGGEAGIRGHLACQTATRERILRDLADWTAVPADTADALLPGLEAETDGKSVSQLEAERDETLAAVLRALTNAGTR